MILKVYYANCEVRGLDVSSYAIDNAEADIKNFLLKGST
jgi:hypothetical protein